MTKKCGLTSATSGEHPLPEQVSEALTKHSGKKVLERRLGIYCRIVTG